MIGKVRPQIFLAIIVLGLLSGVGLYYGMNEIATGLHRRHYSPWYEST